MNIRSLQRQLDMIKTRVRRDDSVLTPEEQEEINRAREDVNEFCTYISGEDQASYHLTLQELADQHRNLIIESPPKTGKSQQLTLRRTAWLIGKNPEIRVGIVCAKATSASDWVRQLKKMITSERYKRVFPHVKASNPWTDQRFTIERMSATSKDPTVQGIGVGGNFLGARIDLMILDDVLTANNTMTKTQREAIFNWIQSSDCNGRVMNGTGRFIFLGNTWANDDAIHRLAESDAFKHHVFKACDYGVTESYLPELWPIEDLQQKLEELGRSKFDCTYLCTPRGDEDRRFKPEWFDVISPYQWMIPTGRPVFMLKEGQELVIGVDLAYAGKQQSDFSAFCVMLKDKGGDKHILYSEQLKGSIHDAIRKMQTLEASFPGCRFNVDSTGTQRGVVDLLKGKIKSPLTGQNTIASATKSNGKEWCINNIQMEVETGRLMVCRDRKKELTPAGINLVNGLVYYTPKDHTPDDVMAMTYAFSPLHKPSTQKIVIT